MATSIVANQQPEQQSITRILFLCRICCKLKEEDGIKYEVCNEKQSFQNIFG